MTEEHPMYEMLRRIRKDLSDAQSKITAAFGLLNTLDLPHPVEHVCPHCGITRPGANPLAEHVYQSHGGDVPAHWLAIEARSVIYEQTDTG